MAQGSCFGAAGAGEAPPFAERVSPVAMFRQPGDWRDPDRSGSVARRDGRAFATSADDMAGQRTPNRAMMR